MSLAAQVTNLTNDRNNIRTSLINKGITEAAQHGFSSFDEDIDRMVKPEGTYTVTENGEYDVTEWEGLIVDVYTVVPIDTPDADAEVDRLNIVVSWEHIQDAECYTVERKHGDDGAWTVLRTLIKPGISDEIEYIDNNYVPGDTYYYRVYAISNGVEHGNSLSSNVVSIVAPSGGGFIDVYKNNDYCEDISGGWVIESYNGSMVEPYDAPITQDGFLEFYYQGTGPMWMHTKNTINLSGDYINGYDTVSFDVKNVSGYSTRYMWIGIIPKDKPSSSSYWYVVRNIYSTSTNTYSFGIKDGEETITSSYYIRNIPSGEYYICIFMNADEYGRILVDNCRIGKVYWDGILLHKPNDFEVEEVTGGYKVLQEPYINELSYDPVSVTKTMSAYGSVPVVIYTPSVPSNRICWAFMANNKIDFGGFSYINLKSFSSVNSGYRYRIMFLDDNYDLVDKIFFESTTTSSSGSLSRTELPDSVKNGKYYIEFELYNITNFWLYDLYLEA